MRNHDHKRSLTAHVFSLALAFTAWAVAARADDLVMPYTCQMIGGRPALMPSSQQGHPITSPREERRIQICSPADPSRCRVWTAHRFNVLCGGVEVPWTAVIANSPPARNGRAWLEDGRLHLAMPPSWNLERGDPCARLMDVDPRQPERAYDRNFERYCEDRIPPSERASVEMPQGFAPMLGLDAIIVASNGPAPPTASPYPYANRPGALPPVRAEPNPATVQGRPDQSLTARPPAGGLTWKASPVAPPAPGALQSGVPADASAQLPLPKKKPQLPSQTTARAEPALKPALPPLENSPAQRDATAEPARPQQAVAARPLTAPAAHSAADTTASPQTVAVQPVQTPAIPSPAIQPNPAAEKVAALPRPDQSPTPIAPPVAPPAAPAIAPAPAQATTSTNAPALSSQSAGADTRTQVAQSAAGQEPYSSRPVKLPSTGPDYKIAALIVAATVALSITGVFWWIRRQRSEAPLPVASHDFASASFDDIRLPGLSSAPDNTGPMHRFDDMAPPAPSYDQDELPPYRDPFENRMELSIPTRDEADPVSHREPGTSYHEDRPDFTLAIPSRDEPDPAHLTTTPAHADPAPLVPHEAPQQPSLWAGASQWPSEIPQTRDDALHILGMGVSSKASLTAMKKIVDGLRLSWHPDHATDDADRAIRNLRIRQINAAWDLITTGQASHGGDPAI